MKVGVFVQLRRCSGAQASETSIITDMFKTRVKTGFLSAWQSEGKTNVPSLLASHLQTLRRHDDIVFAVDVIKSAHEASPQKSIPFPAIRYVFENLIKSGNLTLAMELLRVLPCPRSSTTMEFHLCRKLVEAISVIQQMSVEQRSFWAFQLEAHFGLNTLRNSPTIPKNVTTVDLAFSPPFALPTSPPLSLTIPSPLAILLMEGFARAGNVRETLRYFHMFEPNFLLPMESSSAQPTPATSASGEVQKIQILPLNLVIRAELESNLPESFERALEVLNQMRRAAYASKRKEDPRKSKLKTKTSPPNSPQAPPSRYPAPDEVCESLHHNTSLTNLISVLVQHVPHHCCSTG